MQPHQHTDQLLPRHSVDGLHLSLSAFVRMYADRRYAVRNYRSVLPSTPGSARVRSVVTWRQHVPSSTPGERQLSALNCRRHAAPIRVTHAPTHARGEGVMSYLGTIDVPFMTNCEFEFIQSANNVSRIESCCSSALSTRVTLARLVRHCKIHQAYAWIAPQLQQSKLSQACYRQRSIRAATSAVQHCEQMSFTRLTRSNYPAAERDLAAFRDVVDVRDMLTCAGCHGQHSPRPPAVWRHPGSVRFADLIRPLVDQHRD